MVHQVIPWVKKAIASLADVNAIADAKIIGSWPVAVELSCLDVFQPFSHMITSLCDVGVQLSQIKEKKNTNGTTNLHNAIHEKLVDKIVKFKDHQSNKGLKFEICLKLYLSHERFTMIVYHSRFLIINVLFSK